MATIENFVLRFKVEGQQGIKQISGAIQNLSDDVASFAGVGGNLGNTLTGILGKLGPLGLAAGAAGGAFAALGLKAIDLADSLDDLSGATGISASEILSLKKSIIDAGGGADDYQQMLTKLRQATEEAAGGNEKFRKAFQDIGVYVLDTNGKMRPTSDILQNILEKFQRGEISGKAYAAAVDILGKDLNKLDVTKLQAINDPFQDEQIKQLAKYRTAIDAIGNSITNGILKFFGELAIEMDKSFKKAEEIEKKLNEKGRSGYLNPGFRGFVFNMLGMEPTTPLITKDISAEKAAKDHLANLKEIDAENEKIRQGLNKNTKTPNAGAFGGVSEAEIKAAADSQRKIEASRAEIARLGQMSLYDEVKNISIQAEADIAKARIEIFGKENLSKKQMTAEFAAKEQEIRAKAEFEISKLQEQTNKAISDQLSLIEQNTNLKLSQFEIEKQLSGLSTEQAQKQMKLLDLENARKKALEDMAKIKGIDIGQLADAIEKINEFYESQKRVVEQQYELQRSFEAGWSNAYNSFIENGTNAAKIAADSFNSLTNNMMSALDNFVETGKFNFSDFARSIILDLMKIQLRAAAVQLFQASGIGSLFGVPAKAIGGPVYPNTAYLVGEQGPELFMPNTSGNIVPNNKLGGASGGNTYITNNISAVDSKSVAQLFAENRMSLLGTVEQARRELPLRTR